MAVKREDLLVPLDRNPLEIYLLALCVLAGSNSAMQLWAGHALKDPVSPVMAWVFAGMLFFGGVFGIAGAFWRDAITGVLIVRAAMIPTAAGCAAYAVDLALAGVPMISTLSVVGFGVACAWRAWDITRHVRGHQRQPHTIMRPKDGD